MDHGGRGAEAFRGERASPEPDGVAEGHQLRRPDHVDADQEACGQQRRAGQYPLAALSRAMFTKTLSSQYYVYICDMVQKVEHYRTPLQTLLNLESEIQGTIAGFRTPRFIVDLPKGGGKRGASTYLSYDRETGVSTFKAPAVTAAAEAHGQNEKPKYFEYHDPIGHDARVILD